MSDKRLRLDEATAERVYQLARENYRRFREANPLEPAWEDAGHEERARTIGLVVMIDLPCEQVAKA